MRCRNTVFAAGTFLDSITVFQTFYLYWTLRGVCKNFLEGNVTISCQCEHSGVSLLQKLPCRQKRKDGGEGCVRDNFTMTDFLAASLNMTLSYSHGNLPTDSQTHTSSQNNYRKSSESFDTLLRDNNLCLLLHVTIGYSDGCITSIHFAKWGVCR